MYLTGLNQPQRGRWVIYLSLIVGLVLMLLPLPAGLSVWRPAWLLLILIYWTPAVSGRLGISAAWGFGLLLDIVTGALAGQHALVFSLVVYLGRVLYPRFQVYPLWRQLMAVASLLGVYFMALLAILWLIQPLPSAQVFWAPGVASVVVWPVVFVILSDLRRRYQVSS